MKAKKRPAIAGLIKNALFGGDAPSFLWKQLAVHQEDVRRLTPPPLDADRLQFSVYL